MLRVETVVLVVVAWLIATVNGAWWSAAAAGRVWTDPANWLFVDRLLRRAGRAAFRAAGAGRQSLDDAALAHGRHHRERRDRVFHAHVRRDDGSDDDPEHPQDRYARGEGAPVVVDGGRGRARGPRCRSPSSGGCASSMGRCCVRSSCAPLRWPARSPSRSCRCCWCRAMSRRSCATSVSCGI